MGIFGREPTIGNSNLTQSDLNRLLDLDDKSYRLNGSDDYETPRMSRLPLNYYRRKWAFEKARQAGLLYYVYFCTCDFVNQLMPRPLTMICNAIVGISRFVIRCLWYVINGIFPNPEHFKITNTVQLEPTSYLEEHRHSTKEYKEPRRQENEFRLSRTLSRKTGWNSQTASSDSLAAKLGRLLANIITLGYFFSGDIQKETVLKRRNLDHNADHDEHKWHGHSSFNPVHDLTHNLRRRVRTSSYEYSEDRGSEINSQLTHPAKSSKGLMESFFSRTFYLALMAVLSPVKTLEFTIEKFMWILRGFSHSTYDLRSRTVYRNVSPEETLSYTNRFAKFLSGITTSCFLNIFFLVKKILFLPFIMLSFITGRFLGSSRSEQSLQQQTVGASKRHEHYLIFQIFRFLIDLLCFCAVGFIFFITSLQSVPFYIAESVRERAAYLLAYMFGPKAALLVGYEEVRPVKRKGFATDLDSSAVTSRQKKRHTVASNKSQLFPTRASVKCSSAFWKWLFPLLILLLLLIIFYKRRDGRDDLIVAATDPFYKIQQIAIWRKNIERGLNFIVRNVLYWLSVIFRFWYNLILYPSKLYGAMMHSRKAIEQVVQLPKYVYIAGQSVGTEAMTSTCSDNFFCKIPSELYSLGELVIIHFFERVSVLGSRVCGMIEQVSAIWEWIRIDRLSDNIMDIFLYMWDLISYAVQNLLALPSYFISVATQLIPFINQKMKDVISSDRFNQQQADWALERLKHEKESLESEVLQLRRERELEDRYKNIHKALRIVGKKDSPTSTDKQLKESSLANDELFQYKNNENFLNYMANLRKSDDEELREHLIAIEKRLMERFDTLSGKIENEIDQKIIHNSEQPNGGWSALSNVVTFQELSELSSAVANLRYQFDQLRQEKEAEIAQFAQSIMARDIKRNDDFTTLKTELNKKVKDDLDKELSLSLSRFEKASYEEREAFRLEILKAVENRVIALFASHIAERNGAVSEAKLSSLGLSESDFTKIKKMITDALDMYDADKTGKVDYALESSGASVVSTRCTEPYKENSRLESVFGIPLWYSSYSPRAVIQHRPLAAGECWAFRGKGYLTIKLSHPIHITEVSYEHLHSTLHPDGVLKSAPKLFQVYSYKAVDDLKSKSLIGQYEYDIEGRALQIFHAQNEPKMPVSIVELVVQSNWGSDYTCLYRFRVHGQKA
uniref:SUN domain-containing protein n=1 Tax=Elaeophora elaphi TaxID=1147741 RepID=A0A0R3RUF7_9BILA